MSMNVRNNLEKIREELPAGVKLVAVSKTVPAPEVMPAYEAGQRLFGENKAQELIAKQPLLPDDIQWHFIGHLQTNKVKYIAPFVSMIESVDSLKLLDEINKQGERFGRIINCLLQFHIASEETKFGLSLQEGLQLLASPRLSRMDNIKLCGVMGMATFTDDEEKVRAEFRTLKGYFVSLRNQFFANDDDFREISMGMTGDYRIAVEEGSTLVRIGTAIFGERT